MNNGASGQLKMVLGNIRSIKGKLNEVQVLSFQHDILCLTETHIDSTFTNDELIDSSNKTIYRNDRNIHGGGVLIAVKPSMSQQYINIGFNIAPVEAVCIRVDLGLDTGSDLVLVCLYIPPSMIKYSIDPLNDLLDFIYTKFKENSILIVGDFNFPDVDWVNLTVKPDSNQKELHKCFLNLLLLFQLHQMVRNPTHCKGNTLDLVLTNTITHIEKLNVIEPGLSDHFLVEWEMKSVQQPSSICKSFYNLYHKADISAIEEKLDNTLLKIVEAINQNVSINEVWNIFQNDLQQAVQKFVPKCEIRRTKKNEPMWFDRTAREAVKLQRKLYNRSKQSGSSEDLARYKSLRRTNKRLFRRLEHEHYIRVLFEPLSKGNSKPFYSFYRRKTGQNSYGTSNFQDKSCSETAEIFNEFFQGVFSKSVPYSHPFVETDHSHIIVSQEGVAKLLKDLKAGKAPGPDGLTKKDLNLDITNTAAILKHIFQYSLDKGVLPDIWKTANVVSIYKTGSKESPGNFRPVSLTCISCKLLEHIVLSSISPVLEQFLCPEQHGFRKGLSCSTQLVNTLNDIMAAADKNML